jgi:hypothetical protein
MDDAVYYYMPLFKPGVSVQFRQNRETVSHVVIRRNALRSIWWATTPPCTRTC